MSIHNDCDEIKERKKRKEFTQLERDKQTQLKNESMPIYHVNKYPALFMLVFPVDVSGLERKNLVPEYKRKFIRFNTSEEEEFYEDLYRKIQPEMTINGTVGYDYFEPSLTSDIPPEEDAQNVRPFTYNGFLYKYKNPRKCIRNSGMEQGELPEPDESEISYQRRLYRGCPYVPWESDFEKDLHRYRH